MTKKLTDNEFRELENQFNIIVEQISIMKDSKWNIVKQFGLTPQGFYSRKKSMKNSNIST